MQASNKISETDQTDQTINIEINPLITNDKSKERIIFQYESNNDSEPIQQPIISNVAESMPDESQYSEIHASDKYTEPQASDRQTKKLDGVSKSDPEDNYSSHFATEENGASYQ